MIDPEMVTEAKRALGRQLAAYRDAAHTWATSDTVGDARKHRPIPAVAALLDDLEETN